MMKTHWPNTFKTKLARGIVSIEFVLLMAGVYFPTILGTLEVGRVFYQYNSITKSVRDGVRLISFYSTTDPSYATYQTQAKNLVVYGNTAGSGNALVPGLTTAKVSINTTSVGVNGNIKLVMVTVTGFNLGYITNYFAGSNAFNTISATMRQATT